MSDLPRWRVTMAPRSVPRAPSCCSSQMVRRRRRLRIRDLAVEAGLDFDEALVTLWDEGLDEFDSPDDFVASHQLALARRALGVSDGGEQLTVEYWLRSLGVSREEWTARLAEQGVHVAPDARKIPRGSLRKIRRLFEITPTAVGARPTTRIELPPLQWELVGRDEEVRHLTEVEVVLIHERLEEDFADSDDPIFPNGVREPGLLSSAVTRPHTALGSTRKYPTVPMAGAALFHSLVHNHAFHNGNKRTGLVGLLAVLDENGLVLTCSQEDLFRFTLRTAQHRLVADGPDELADREVLEIARWIRGHSRPLDKGERPMKWIRLKQRLREFGCDYGQAGGVGNRINVWRDVNRPRRLGRPKVVRLSTQVAYGGDGTEADRSTVHKLRKDLELDDDHDIDSGSFYGGEVIDSFIIDYRRILRRLAKL